MIIMSNYYAIVLNDGRYLEHHGKLGMKWGIRRYQNYDGSLTAEGRRRYGIIDNLKDRYSQHKDNVYKSYKEKGLSDDAAKTATQQRLRTEKFIAGAAAVTVTAASIHAAKRIGSRYIDERIPKGAQIQNISFEEKGKSFNRDFNKPFYGTFKLKDRAAYAGNFAKKHGSDKDVYKTVLNANKDLKIASEQHSYKIYKKLMKNDPEFREAALKGIAKNGEKYTNVRLTTKGLKGDIYGRNKLYEKAMNDIKEGKFSKRSYDAFNIAVPDSIMKDNGAQDKFYNALRKKGYSGIKDMNDRIYGGYKTSSATIFINSTANKKLLKNDLSTNNVEKIGKDFIKENNLTHLVNLVGYHAPRVATAIAVPSVVATNARSQKIVDDYLKEHPNSKLSREEILKAYKKTR